MSNSTIDWTHKNIKFSDIRKNNHLYILSIVIDSNIKVVTIKNDILIERLENYYLKPITEISRKEILDLEWNLYLTKGYYVKVHNDMVEKFYQDPNKYYVSFLDISGVLGKFNVITKSKL